VFCGVLRAGAARRMTPRAAHAGPPRVDMGTCGNACCTVDWTLKVDPVSLVAAMESALSNGGAPRCRVKAESLSIA
jgi:hypothetical protein